MGKLVREQVQKQRRQSITNGNNYTTLQSARLWKTRQTKQLSKLSGRKANKNANLLLKSTILTLLEAKKQKLNQRLPVSQEEINLNMWIGYCLHQQSNRNHWRRRQACLTPISISLRLTTKIGMSALAALDTAGLSGWVQLEIHRTPALTKRLMCWTWRLWLVTRLMSLLSTQIQTYNNSPSSSPDKTAFLPTWNSNCMRKLMPNIKKTSWMLD